MIKIYGLLNPIDNKYFYVGATGQPLKKRLTGHTSSTDKNEKKVAIVKSILEKGLRPLIVLLERPSDDCDPKEREIAWMQKLKSEGHDIVNKSFTGVGSGPKKNAKIAITLFVNVRIIEAFGGVDELKKKIYEFIEKYERPDSICGTEDGI
jgi:hypothetical protein